MYIHILIYKLFWVYVEWRRLCWPPHTFVFNGYIVGAGVDKLLPRSADDLKCRTLLHYKTQNSTQLNSIPSIISRSRNDLCSVCGLDWNKVNGNCELGTESWEHWETGNWVPERSLTVLCFTAAISNVVAVVVVTIVVVGKHWALCVLPDAFYYNCGSPHTK